MKLCYEAATIVYSDLKALYMDDAWLSEYRRIDEDALSALQAERKSRYTSLFQNVEVCNTAGCYKQDVLSMDGINFSSEDCMGYERRIHNCNTFIQVIKITGGVGMTPHQSAEWNCNNLSKAVQTLKDAMLTVYDVDQEELDGIAEPIWLNVHARYGVIFPEGN